MYCIHTMYVTNRRVRRIFLQQVTGGVETGSSIMGVDWVQPWVGLSRNSKFHDFFRNLAINQ